MFAKQTLAIGLLAFGLLIAGCAESGMRANEDTVEVPEGTQIHVRLDGMTGGAYKDGDEVQGTLERPLEWNGRVIAPAGTIVRGEFTDDLGRKDAMGTDGEYAKDDTRSTDRDRTATDGTIADDDAASGTGTRADRDDRAEHPDRPGTGGTYAGRADQLGIELSQLVLNGEEFDIDTEAVPIHGLTEDKAVKGSKDQSSSMSLPHSMVFTLAEKAELPTNQNAKTE